jgi:hypothetical protein
MGLILLAMGVQCVAADASMTCSHPEFRAPRRPWWATAGSGPTRRRGVPGFKSCVERYPGYSADFFDGKHYVLQGTSWATDNGLIRRSFRNWYQGRVPFVFRQVPLRRLT